LRRRNGLIHLGDGLKSVGEGEERWEANERVVEQLSGTSELEKRKRDENEIELPPVLFHFTNSSESRSATFKSYSIHLATSCESLKSLASLIRVSRSPSSPPSLPLHTP